MPTIPLKIFITPFAENGHAEPSSWTPSAASDLLLAANHIWSIANIQFHLKECVVDTPLDIPKSTRRSGDLLLDALSYRHPDTTAAIVFLVNSVPGLNYDLTYPEDSCSYVMRAGDLRNNAHFLAHELGHQLGLDDIKVGRTANQSLMYESLNGAGSALSTGEIIKAKKSKLVKRFGG